MDATGAETITLAGGGTGELDAPLARGAAVGRYVVLELVGQGGMGRVYSAYDPELDRKVALKLLHPGATGPRAQRLLDEAKALGRLSHPNVLTVFDAGRFAGGLYLATELIDGVSLAHWLASTPRSRRSILRQFRAAGRGLAAAHAAGLVHRDFKPANAMVDADQQVRVVDFGLALGAVDRARERGIVTLDDLDDVNDLGDAEAEIRHEARRSVTPGRGAGTPAYMAPEQRVCSDVGPAADQYAFAVALWEALTGTLPARPKEQGNSVGGRAASRALPMWIRRPLERGLATDPDDRFASMADLLAALERDPGRVRQRWLATAVGLGLVVAVPWTLVRVSGRAGVHCAAGANAMAEIWDASRRERVRQSLTSGAMPSTTGAVSAVSATVASIDRYVAAWRGAYQASCQATHREGVQSPALLDLRIDCLTQRRRELDALVRTLATDASVQAARAAEAAGALVPLARCADTRALQAPVAPPESIAAASQVETLGERLAELSVLEGLGNYERATLVAAELVVDAEALGYWPLTAEARLALGRIEEQASDGAAADTLDRALDAAVAGGHDRVAAEVLVRLVRVHGYQRNDQERGQYFGTLATAALARLSAPVDLEAELADHLGRLAYQAGDLERAGTLHRKALSLRQTDPGDPEAASSALRLASIEAEQGALDDAEAHARAAVATYQRVYGDGHPRLAVALTNLGGFQHRAGRTVEGLEATRRALAIQVATLGHDNPRTADTRLQEATLLLALGKAEEALTGFEQVREVYRAAYGDADARTANIDSYIAGVHADRGEHDIAASLFRRALRGQVDLHGEDHPWVALTRYNLAVQLKDGDRGAEAIREFQRALATFEQSYGRDHYLVAAVLTGLGQSLIAVGQPDGATVQLERALAIREAQAERDPSLLASTRFSLARALVAAGKERRRAQHLGQAALDAYRALGETDRGEEVVLWVQQQGLTQQGLEQQRGDQP